MAEPTPNRTLYDRGRQYADRVNGVCTLEDVAKADGEGLKEIRIPYNFAGHVDAIAAVVPGARALILDGDNPHLTPYVVQRVAGRKPPGIEAAMARAAAGLHPFAPDPPADWGGARARWHYDFDRLGTAQALLERVAKVGERPGRALPAAVRTNLMIHATAIGADLAAMRPVFETEERQPSVAPPRPQLDTPPEVVRWAKNARKLVEAVTGDLLRAVQTRALDAARDELGQRVSAVAALVDHMRARFADAVPAVTPPQVITNSGRMLDTSGTYLVVLRVKTAGVVRIARHGTFGFPAGYLLYVGSAFGQGGVAARVARHLGGTGSQLWGLDSLRGFGDPVEAWWTHHGQKVECTWARALAGVPACSCPAPLVGASDCNASKEVNDKGEALQRCPAHLFHTEACPSVDAFAEQLGRSGSGGYTVHCRPAAQALAAAKGMKVKRQRGKPGSFSPFG